MTTKPLLCRLGLHKRFKYLPRVSGDLGEISIACRRCGYGLRYFEGTWDITPEEVQASIKNEAKIEYGRLLSFFRFLPFEYDMKASFESMKDRFTPTELEPIAKQMRNQVMKSR